MTYVQLSSVFVILTFVEIVERGGGGQREGVKRGDVHKWCLCHFCYAVL